MDAPSSPSALRSPPARQHRRPVVWFAIISGILLLAIVVLVSVSFLPDPKIVWLKPTDLNRPRQSTILTRLKFNVARLVWPVAGRFWPHKTSIRIDASCLTLSAAAGEQTGLGVPFATNADGLRIWVLSPDELASFQRHLKDLPGASLISGPRSRIQTANGIQAEMSVGGPTNRLAIDLLPRVVSSSIRLTIGATATEWGAPPFGKAALVKTNFAAACRALVPNAGGLVMAATNTKDDSENAWWFIASPVKVDAQGNPIKP